MRITFAIIFTAMIVALIVCIVIARRSKKAIAPFTAMLLASLITAVCVSFLGVIGFVGVICPHVVKRLIGQDHRVSIPASLLAGSLLLLLADTLSRSIGSGSALPVGAITSLLGAPFFLAILFSRKERRPAHPKSGQFRPSFRKTTSPVHPWR